MKGGRGVRGDDKASLAGWLDLDGLREPWRWLAVDDREPDDGDSGRGRVGDVEGPPGRRVSAQPEPPPGGSDVGGRTGGKARGKGLIAVDDLVSGGRPVDQ